MGRWKYEISPCENTTRENIIKFTKHLNLFLLTVHVLKLSCTSGINQLRAGAKTIFSEMTGHNEGVKDLF